MEIPFNDFLHVREEALKREELIKLNYFLKKEITRVEDKITGTQLKIEKIDRELAKSSSYSDQANSEKIKFYNSLLEENKTLRKMHEEFSELKLRSKLTYNAKEAFKKKYEDAISSSISYDPALSPDDQKLSLEINQLRLKIQETESQTAEILKEKEHFKKKVIPVLENTLKLYEKNKGESEKKIETLKSDLKARVKKSETHSASPVSSKSSSAKNLHAVKSEAKVNTKNSKPKTYMPSYLNHRKPSIKRNSKNRK